MGFIKTEIELTSCYQGRKDAPITSKNFKQVISGAQKTLNILSSTQTRLGNGNVPFPFPSP